MISIGFQSLELLSLSPCLCRTGALLRLEGLKARHGLRKKKNTLVSTEVEFTESPKQTLCQRPKAALRLWPCRIDGDFDNDKKPEGFEQFHIESMLEKVSKPLEGFPCRSHFRQLFQDFAHFFQVTGPLQLLLAYIYGTGQEDLSKVFVGTFGATTMHIDICKHVSNHHMIERSIN